MITDYKTTTSASNIDASLVPLSTFLPDTPSEDSNHKATASWLTMANYIMIMH